MLAQILEQNKLGVEHWLSLTVWSWTIKDSRLTTSFFCQQTLTHLTADALSQKVKLSQADPCLIKIDYKTNFQSNL